MDYVRIDTQSNPHSSTCPSTEKQKNLSKKLEGELQAMGVLDAKMDELGYVYATLPSNSSKSVPTICFCSHVDTSPDCSGENVQPVLHKNYQGGTIHYERNPNIVLNPDEHPDLKEQVGNDIITSDGTTLLGADNKSGVAAIMDMVHYFTTHPEEKHGTIKVLFTPDEEIGRGADNVDIAKLNADFGYTIDGEKRGTFEDETFSADGAIIRCFGISAHPGFAKNKLVNALKVASEVMIALNEFPSPEQTEGREAFIHPLEISGNAEEAQIDLIIRSFDNDELHKLGAELKSVAERVADTIEGSKVEVVITEQYRNMKEVIDKHPEISEYALEAIQSSGIEPIHRSIRGGTDGSKLSFMGLPCPNIFAGEHAFHSKLEWVSVQDMQKSVEVMVRLIQLWEKRSSPS